MSEQLNESSSLPLHVCVMGLQGKCWHLGLKPYPCLLHRNSNIQCIGHWMTLPCHLPSPCSVCLCSGCVFECHIVSFHGVFVCVCCACMLKACLCVCMCVLWPLSGVTVWFHGSSYTWLVRLFLADESAFLQDRLTLGILANFLPIIWE